MLPPRSVVVGLLSFASLSSAVLLAGAVPLPKDDGPAKASDAQAAHDEAAHAKSTPAEVLVRRA